eukprot:CAMPEP_0180330376 /NCGR_PEP_ID=MMETSP0988-20121125/41300_1 /TAXON_ID=697907 /ORGANISM="non described non described, Strain CCMP2293" /LENGTH=35 /DNA_ID= /DNA_START= /DNA_END= /DNA_ORIENTATION=
MTLSQLPARTGFEAPGGRVLAPAAHGDGRRHATCP